MTPFEHLKAAVERHQAGHLADAEAIYRRLLKDYPNHADAMHLLGVVHHQRGNYHAAVELIENAIRLNPTNADYHGNLALAQFSLGRFQDTAASFQRVVELKPGAKGYCDLGAILNRLDQPDRAAEAFEKAIACDPKCVAGYAGLGIALSGRGQADRAVTVYREGIERIPTDAGLHSNLLYMLHFDSASEATAIADEHRRWNERHAKPLKKLVSTHRIERDPERRLRIGYVSPYFRWQAESFFVLPLLESHDHGRFEVHAYATKEGCDEITGRHKSCVDVWHDVSKLSDAELADRIGADRVDILIDLAMHMSYNRALAFARKPAPIQICWLAYPGGTGMQTMDYRVSDNYMDPPDGDQAIHLEQPIRLPDCWCCYDPLCDIPPVAARSAPLRFGSLNAPQKLNEPLLRLWARVMEAVPGSLLLLQVISDTQRRWIIDLFQRAGIAASRLEFVGYCKREAYLRLYDRIDLCLDPLPYNGITTSCDALWMGVPVVTLAGKTPAGRAGLSFLHALGLPELTACDADQFVSMTAALAGDRARLNELRTSLRGRMRSSPLMDGRRFARSMEEGYRQAWRKWCFSRVEPPPRDSFPWGESSRGSPDKAGVERAGKEDRRRRSSRTKGAH